MLAWAPLRSFAQSPEASDSTQSSTPAPDPNAAIPPANAAARADQSPAPATAPQRVAEASGPSPNSKQERQAEKLYLRGAKALDENNPRTAFDDFTSAVSLDPANLHYTAAKEIARQHLITSLIQEAGKARLTGHPDVSLQKLQEAYALDPKSPIVAQHINELADSQRIGIDPLDEHGDEMEGPIELTPSNEKKSFHIKSTQQEVLRQVLSAYGLKPIMDSSVTDKPARLDVDDVDYAQASQMAKLITGTFFVPLDPKRVLVAKDSRENRMKFERLMVESIYLPGLSSTELTDMSNIAKNVFEAPVAVLQPQNGIMTVKAPETRMKALNVTLEELMDGRSQVMVEVRLFDINKVRSTNIGVQLPSQANVFNVKSELLSLLQNNSAAIQQIISSGLAAPGDYGAILAILIATGQISGSVLTQGFFTFGGGLTQFGVTTSGTTGNLSLNASDVRTLDDIQVRVQDQETATFKVGTRYPIVTSTYSSTGVGSNIPGLNGAGTSSALNGLGVNLSGLAGNFNIPQIQYQDLGLTLKAIPRVQHGQEVALNMDLQFTALGGSTLNGNPILNNRQYTATVTLPDGESALVVSSLSKQETRAVVGIPGLSELPGLQSTTNESKDLNVSTLVLLVTPHIVRRSHTEMAGRQIALPRHD
jgi:type II secretory pathway component GspD/PulD (secretin)